jgi:hypothetical protein
MGMILSLDKIAKLTFSYAGALSKSPGLVAISSVEKAILGQQTENAGRFQQEFAAGFVPSSTTTISAVRDGHALPSSKTTGGFPAAKLAEAQSTLQDLTTKDTPDQEPKASAHQKKSLFVADAFSNPRYVQFALKVTLAGMLGYFFYTASDSPIDQLVEEKDLGSRVNYHSDSLEELIGAVREFQILASGREEAQPT